MEDLTRSLGFVEGLRWLLVPACLQWMILEETERRPDCRVCRWLILLTLWMPLLSFIVPLLLIAGGGMLITVLFQTGARSFFSGTADVMAFVLSGQQPMYLRFALLVAGWGGAWAVYRFDGRAASVRGAAGSID